MGRKRRHDGESEGIKDEGIGSTGRTSDQGSKRTTTPRESESDQVSTRRAIPREVELRAPAGSGTGSTPAVEKTKGSKTPSAKPKTLREGVERIFGKQ